MKIIDLEAIYLKIPNINSNKCDGTQDTLIIRIHTDEGVIGLGEVDSSPVVAKAVIEAPASHSIATGLKNLLVGENPIEVERLWHKMYEGTFYFGRSGPVMHAISGVDMALWDIIGKVNKNPVSIMLGGMFHKKLKAYASLLMPDTIKETGQLAEKYAKQGYLAIKFGWGPIGRNFKFDVEQIKTIRSAVGNDIDIMIDAGLVWDLKEALKIAEVYEKFNVFWLEEPLKPNNIQGYNELTSRTKLLIAAGEQESNWKAFQILLDNGNIDVIQPDLGRCGGFTEAKKIANMAYNRHKKLVPHAFKTGILDSASSQFAASIPNGFMIEHTVSNSSLATDLVENPLELKDGFIHIPQSPGLGVTLNDQIVNKYQVN